MNTDDRVLNSGWPEDVSVELDSVTTTAPFPLSYTPTTSPTVLTVPATGIGANSSMACSPCTSIAGLNEPMFDMAPPPPTPSTTAIVGSTFWSVSAVFSVVNSSSSKGSAAPAPTPSA